MSLRALAGIGSGIGSEELFLCWLIEIQMPDGTFRRACSLGGTDLTIGGNLFSGSYGFDVTTASFSSGSSAPSIGLSNPAVSIGPLTFEEAASGLISGLPVRLWIADAENSTRDEIGSKWYIGTIETNDAGRATFELKSASRKAMQLFLRRYGPVCSNQLGDARCGVNLASYTDTVTVSSVTDAFTFAVTGSARANDYFALGAIKFTAGDNNGLSYDVRKWTLSGGIIKLASALKRPVQIGDTATIHAGCDRTSGAAGCTRFANIVRFFGFEHLPDENLSYPVRDADAPTATVESSGIWGSGSGSGSAWG